MAANEFGTMLWSSIVYVLHVDTISLTTKSNWILEYSSPVLLMLRLDVVAPHWLKSETLDHTFATIIIVCSEFTDSGFILSVQKMRQHWNCFWGELVYCLIQWMWWVCQYTGISYVKKVKQYSSMTYCYRNRPKSDWYRRGNVW